MIKIYLLISRSPVPPKESPWESPAGCTKNAAAIYEIFGQFDDGIGPDNPFGVCSTTNYSVFKKGIGFATNLLEQHIIFDLEISNLFNEDFRNFLNTCKGYALSPGRSIILRLSL